MRAFDALGNHKWDRHQDSSPSLQDCWPRCFQCCYVVLLATGLHLGSRTAVGLHSPTFGIHNVIANMCAHHTCLPCQQVDAGRCCLCGGSLTATGWARPARLASSRQEARVSFANMGVVERRRGTVSFSEESVLSGMVTMCGEVCCAARTH